MMSDHLMRLLFSINENNKCAAWNQWRRAYPDEMIDLRHGDFQHADLCDVNLYSANLTYADLSYANLSGANLERVHLRDTHLRGAILNNVHLQDAGLKNADLKDADLSGAICFDTVFADIDLRTVQGLDSIKHQGPSYLSIDCIYRSQGQISDVFLRGCGVSDDMIGYIHSIAGAIQYYSAFISYNSEDEPFAHRLYSDLQARNVRCWKYTEDMKIGDKILQRVDEAIRFHDKLLLILSESSLTSDWVEREVLLALEREHREKRTLLFPVRIDDAILHSTASWARLIQTRNIGDFTRWKGQDVYQPTFERLLRDLKQTTPA